MYFPRLLQMNRDWIRLASNSYNYTVNCPFLVKGSETQSLWSFTARKINDFLPGVSEQRSRRVVRCQMLINILVGFDCYGWRVLALFLPR